MSNTIGHCFRLTTFGESHGVAIGGVVDGMPAGILIDESYIQSELDRRRPGQSEYTTSRKEADKVKFLSGIFEGKSTGCPIGFIVENTSQRSSDYEILKDLYRPSHADFTYMSKYGIRDYRGGGRASARITISRCVAGALAKLVLSKYGISIHAYTSQIGNVALNGSYSNYDLSLVEQSAVRCPDLAVSSKMEQLIAKIKAEGDTLGGVVSCVIKSCPVGLGEPEFNKLQSNLAAAMLSINAAKGFEYGDGFALASMRGSEANDEFLPTDPISTRTNHSGGIQGGITNGQDIFFRVAFKPIPTLLREQSTVDKTGKAVVFKAQGRHDTCVVPRAVPIVEAMAAIIVLDAMLMAGKLANNL